MTLYILYILSFKEKSHGSSMVLLTGFYITDMSRQMRKTKMEVNPFPLTLLARPTLHGTSRNTLETGGYKKNI